MFTFFDLMSFHRKIYHLSSTRVQLYNDLMNFKWNIGDCPFLLILSIRTNVRSFTSFFWVHYQFVGGYIILWYAGWNVSFLFENSGKMQVWKKHFFFDIDLKKNVFSLLLRKGHTSDAQNKTKNVTFKVSFEKLLDDVSVKIAKKNETCADSY